MSPTSDLSAVAGTGPSSSVVLEVPARSDEVAGIRKAVTAFARRVGVAEDRLPDIALAVGEACANAVVHAFTDREPGLLRVTADLTPDGVEVVVVDDGQGMAPRPDSPGLGLGLPLMTSLTKEIEFRPVPSGGTEISMVFGLDGPAASADWAHTG